MTARKTRNQPYSAIERSSETLGRSKSAVRRKAAMLLSLNGKRLIPAIGAERFDH